MQSEPGQQSESDLQPLEYWHRHFALVDEGRIEINWIDGFIDRTVVGVLVLSGVGLEEAIALAGPIIYKLDNYISDL